MAVNIGAMNTVYNHYLTSYAPKGTTPFDTHKKSELRSLYNSIIKLNKESPLFMLDTSKDAQQFAVSLKEDARELRNNIASLGGLDEQKLLNKKKAYSSNEGIATVTFIGELSPDSPLPSLSLEVTHLATPQVNTGNPLPGDIKVSLPSAAYSFDISIKDLNYEFQFNINEDDTHKDIQDRLAKLITNADIGIKATTIQDDENNTALQLESLTTGISLEKSMIFAVSDEKTTKLSGVVDYLGIGEISREPTNADFLINGTPHSSTSNCFAVEKAFEITLKGISSTEGEATNIGIKTDTESMSENIFHLVDSYNTFMKAANDYHDKEPNADKLINEMQHISSYYKNDLHSLGLSLDDYGSIEVDSNRLTDSFDEEDGNEKLSSLRHFTNSVLRKTEQISINPMNYVNKTIVAYKNPGKNFASPYITSAYSGMMFNSYC